MEMTRAEVAAVAAVDGMPAELLDAMGRLVVTPHALTQEGQRNVPADLQPGESLAAFLGRHVPGIESGAWVVSIGGSMVPRAMWGHVYPKHGMHIACRAVVAKQAVALVAIAALTYFSGGLAAGLYGAMGGTYVAASAGFALAAIQAGIVIAGSMLINKVLGPKVPKVGDVAAARQVYSLSSQRNSPRLYEPIGVLWGEVRVSPDLASQSYTWPEGEDQYMSVILLGGINVHTAADLSVGDTPITSYTDVSVFHNGFSGMPSVAVPLYSNVDTIAGGELPDTTAWVTRTSSAGAVGLHVDLEYQLFTQGNKGLKRAYLNLEAQYRAVGTTAWQNLFAPKQLSNNTTENRRATFGKTVPSGQYEVRMRRLDGPNPDKTTRQVAWTSLRAIQADTTDYSQWGRIGIKIKATGQLSGSLDTLRATYRARPLPVWDGLAWVTATTREEGLSNPGAIILQTLRGVYAKDRDGKDVLQWGYGMSDEQIDIEGLKAFMLHCKARGYTYDRWVTQQMSLQQFCDEVALAGMGQFTWTDGSRPTVAFVSSGQPISAVVNMANMKKAGFSVDYVLGNAADGIEYQYLDRNTWETKTLRVTAPGVTTMLNPARVTGEGVTSEAHAAVLARYHLAQSLYQFKTVHFQADIEHLDYRRLSVLSVSHDLTQWGFGGRVMAAQIVGGKIRLQLDEPVPPLATPHMGLRIPGERDYRVWPMVPMIEASDMVELVGEWPAGVAFPGDGLDNPAHDTLWCADFKPTPGYRVRVTSIEPESDLSGAAVSCVPEGPEFWDYVLNGAYVPAPNQSSIPQLGRPTARDLRVQEQVNVQGDTEWYELHVQWEVDGDYDHAQVWAGRDGSELRLVDGNATGTRTTFRIDGAGEWLIDVRPFSPGGRVGQSAALLYITMMTQLPPRNVDQFVVQSVPGGLRRFAWQYTGDQPPAFAGVQIRYVPDDVALSTADWDAMTPLGEAGDIYTAQFETTKPQAGLWTFGLRAIDTAGQLSSGIVRFAILLDDSFEQVQQPDLTPPPAPTGLVAAGGLSTVMVSWDVPLYTQGHGHARTEIWASQGVELETAVKLAEGYAGPVSFGSPPAITWSIWARHVSVDGVPGDWTGPVPATTGEDVQGLLEALHGQVTEGVLHQSLTERIDIIDKTNGVLGRSLVDAAAQQDALNQSVRVNIDEMAQGLLEAALAADAALERITDAGVYVDPETGTVKIYGLEVTKGEVTSLQVLLDTLGGQLQLKASTAYVDGKIAEATLSPADLLLYEGLDARLVEVTQTLDSINGVLDSKASQLELTGALARLTTAETELDGLQGEIALRVTRAEYEAGQDAVNSRLGSAELMLSTLDVPSITATVLSAARGSKDADKAAQALLQSIIAAERTSDEQQQALAYARQDLTAAYQEGLSAEAAQRLQLLAKVDAQAAALQEERVARANGDSAEASARQTLAATVADNSAVIDTEVRTRAEQTGHLGGLYSVRMQLAQGDRQVIGGFALSGSTSQEAGPTLDFGVLASKFFVAAPKGSGIDSSFQLTVQTVPTTANGVTIPAGLYVDSAFITNVNSLWGRFGSLVADSIQATAISASQLTAGNGVIGGTLKSSNYMAGSSGWTLRPDGVAEFSGVIVRGTVYATAGQVGGVTIASNELRSSNWNNVYGPGGLGWVIRANGTAYFNDLSVRGQVNGGAFNGYAWPAAGQSGFYLGPEGLLIGNANNGRYLQVTAAGDIYTPGFSVVNGVMTVQQANIIDTLQIKSGALSSVAERSPGSFSFFVSTSRTLDDFSVSAEYQNIVYMEWVNNIGGDGLHLTAYRGSGEGSVSVNVDYPGAYARVELRFYAQSEYLGSASVEVFQGIGNYVITPMYAVPLGTSRVLANMPPISRNSPEGQRSLNNIKITTISIKR